MPVFISMLRAVNVGGYGKINMQSLRELYVSLKFEDAQTFIQSGNVIFRTASAGESALAEKIRSAIEKKFGFAPEVILRSADQMRETIANNPFAKRKDVEPAKLAIIFLSSEPSAEARKQMESIEGFPEEIHLRGRDLYIYFPNGIGKSKLPPVMDRILKKRGTARNWNSVTKMMAIAETLEA